MAEEQQIPQVTLPRSWTKHYHREALFAQVGRADLWGKLSPTTPLGRDLLALHEDLFHLLDESTMEFRLVMTDHPSFIAVPLLPQNQGIALSQGLPSTVEVSVFLYPAFYSSQARDQEALLTSLHFPLARGKGEDLLPLLEKLWPAPVPEKMAVIPFSLESAAVLYGPFLDEMDKTRSLCLEAVREETKEQAAKNCQTFLDTVTQIVSRGFKAM